MENKILIFHPDIYVHNNASTYTKNIYWFLGEKRTIKSLEWFMKHPFSKDIDTVFLFWYENLIGDSDNYLLQKIQYWLKLVLLKITHVRKIRIVYGIHNRAPHDIDTSNKKIFSLYVRFMFKAVELADCILTANMHIADQFEKEFGIMIDPKKVKYVPIGGVQLNSEKLIPMRKEYRIREDELLFCSIGKIDRYKNVDKIIKAFKSSKLTAKLLIVGRCDLDYRRELLNLIANDSNIICDFRSPSDQEMASFLRVADVIVLPYEKTSYNSGILLEAFLNGTTILGTDILMLQDYPRDLYYAYNYTNDEEHLQKLICGMKKVMQDYDRNPEILRKKGDRLEQIALASNSWARVKECLFSAVFGS